MITLKLKYESDSDFSEILSEGNKVVRIGFNLFKKGLSITQVERKIKKDYLIWEGLDASMIRSFLQDAESLHKAYVETGKETLVFGSKKSWKDFNSGKITKKEFFEKRNSNPLMFNGSKCDTNGNRKFSLDIENKQIIFKERRGKHHKLKLSTSKRRLRILAKLQEAAASNLIPLTYRISKDYVYVIFNEKILNESSHDFVKDRVASLDLNPNYIGLVIQDFAKNKIIFRQIFDLTKLHGKSTNKIKHEVCEVARTISRACKHYRVEICGFEKLDMKSKDHKKGKKLNRLINNFWQRNLFVNNLKKRLNILGIKNQEIIAAYSSTVGCIQYPEETDSIAAALEIGRRAYIFKKKYLDKEKEFLDAEVIFPCFDYKKIAERWNSKLSAYKTKRKGWKSLHNHLRDQKKLTQLRFLFKDYPFTERGWSFLRNRSRESFVSSVCLK